MNAQAHRISAGQLVFLLFCARIFTLLTYMPHELSSNISPFWAILGGGATVLLMGVPLLLLFHRTGVGVPEAAARAGRGVSLAVHLTIGVFCLLTAAFTIWHFGVFMMSTLFHNASPWVFLIGMSLAATYAAQLGLEPVARLGLPVFLMTVAAAVAILAGLWQYMNWEQILLLPEDGWRTALASGRQGISVYAEAVLFLVLASRAGKSGTRTGVWCGWIVLSAVVALWFALTTQAALGEYAGTKMFPIHAATGAAQLPSVERLDILYLFLWCFAAFVRTAAYLYAAGVCLGGIVPGMKFAPRVWTVGGVAAVLTLTAALWQPFGNWLTGFWRYAIWVVLLLVGIPVLLLVIPKTQSPAPKEEVG